MRLAKASPGEGKGLKSEERVARLRANISKLRRVRGEVEDFSEREARSQTPPDPPAPPVQLPARRYGSKSERRLPSFRSGRQAALSDVPRGRAGGRDRASSPRTRD